jgi:adenylosuccinate lyase
MAYKRNPVRSERMCSLARRLITDSLNGPLNASTQWLERSLDDSANRRLSIPQAFLAADAILILANNVVRGLAVYPEIIRARMLVELPFMATENILLLAARHGGGDRQRLHGRLRAHSMAVRDARRHGRSEKGLIERIEEDPEFAAARGLLGEALDPSRYIGRAPQQVEEFFREEVDPWLERFPAAGDTGGKDRGGLSASPWEIKV